MTSLQIHRDGWIPGGFDDFDEAIAMTRLRIKAGTTVITRNFSSRGGGESEAINVSLLPLAAFIASSWWQLLYEPLRSSDDPKFQARHRLDLPMHGYVFPAIAIYSAGDEAVTLDWNSEQAEYSPIEFRASAPSEPLQVSRDDAEPVLMDLIEAVIDRISTEKLASHCLYAAWNRVRESMEAPGELAYCVLAGRLGIDPYDADSPDLGDFGKRLSPKLLDDVAEAAKVTELGDVADWVTDASTRLSDCPLIDVGAFGPVPVDNVGSSAGVFGFHTARALRHRLKLNTKPKKAVEELLGDAVNKRHAVAEKGPPAITALTERANGVARIGTVAMSARQQRFRACAGAYLAWTDESVGERAGTIAHTRKQQASRAFAAEILAPTDVLRDRAGPYGFTSDDIEALASDLICPFETVLWQSYRAGVPLRGIDSDPSRAMRVFAT